MNITYAEQTEPIIDWRKHLVTLLHENKAVEYHVNARLLSFKHPKDESHIWGPSVTIDQMELWLPHIVARMQRIIVEDTLLVEDKHAVFTAGTLKASSHYSANYGVWEFKTSELLCD